MDAATPLWVTLLVAAAGVAATLLAALTSSALTARREAGRAREEVEREQARAREAVAAEAGRSRDAIAREVERARESSGRDAALRALEERRAAYASFLTTASRWQRYAEQKRDQRAARSGGVVPLDATGLEDEVDRALAAVQLSGAPATQDPARAAYDALVVTMMNLEASHFSINRVDEGCEQIARAIGDYLAAVRADLGVDPPPPAT